jgi:hypothetical protein
MAVTLRVKRAEVRRAIRIATMGVNSHLPVEIRISHDGVDVEIVGAGSVVTIPGSGHWPGYAFVPGRLLKQYACRLPRGESLHLEFRDGRVWFGSLGLSARWEERAGPAVPIAAGASYGDVLAFAAAHAGGVVTRSGVQPAVDAARKALRRRIGRAVKGLADFGISSDDLWALAEKRLGEREAL